MKINSKYSRFHKQQDEPISIQYISKDTIYQKRLISVPDYVNSVLDEKIDNVSAYLTDLAIKDLRIRKPISEQERERLEKEMKDFE